MHLLLRGLHSLKNRTGMKRIMAATQQFCSSVTSGKKRINGVDLYYEQTGTGKNAVLMIPGSMGSIELSFRPQMTLLNKERFTLVGFDPRGYGLSRPPTRDFPPDVFERDAKDAVDLMKELGFDKFSVLGHSAGGAVALIAAAKNPDLIDKAVVWGTSSYISQQDVKLLLAMDVAGDTSVVDQLMEYYGQEEFFKIWDGFTEAVKQISQRPEGNICKELLPLVKCPTLIIHGEKDCFVPTDHPMELLKHIQKSRLILKPDQDHNLHLNNIEEFNKMVEAFLGSQDYRTEYD